MDEPTPEALAAALALLEPSRAPRPQSSGEDHPASTVAGTCRGSHRGSRPGAPPDDFEHPKARRRACGEEGVEGRDRDGHAANMQRPHDSANPSPSDPPEDDLHARGSDRHNGPPYPVPSDELDRAGLCDLVESVAPRLGLPPSAMALLRVLARACPWSHFADSTREPVCFRSQTSIADELELTTKTVRQLERRLERAGVISRRMPANGHRGRLAPRGEPSAAGVLHRTAGGSERFVAGLCLSPLVANVPLWRALAERQAEDRRAMTEARAAIKLTRGEIGRVMDGLPLECEAWRMRRDVYPRGFPRLSALKDRDRMEGHLAELTELLHVARRDAPQREMDLEALLGCGEAHHEVRCHTDTQTNPPSRSCTRSRDDASSIDRNAGADCEVVEAEKKELEESEARRCNRRHTTETAPKPHGDAAPAGRASTQEPSDDRPQEGSRTTSSEPSTGLTAAFRARLTPLMVEEMGSDVMSSYVGGIMGRMPHAEPSVIPPTLAALQQAAELRRRDAGLSWETWGQACAVMGRLDALLCWIVVDRKREDGQGGSSPGIRDVEAYMRELIDRAAKGRLNLEATMRKLMRTRHRRRGLRQGTETG